MNVLLTGGAGYIGSHTAVELVTRGHTVLIIDNMSNSCPEVIQRLQTITGQEIDFYQGDVRDKALLTKIFDLHQIDAVIHLAGLKVVSDSVSHPIAYYQNNCAATLNLCEVMQEKAVKKLIFSSSAAVYGEPQELPLRETSRTGVGITSPYGHTKYLVEQMLADIAQAHQGWQLCALRYFNPIGAHESGLIGQDTAEHPTNIMSYITRVASGKAASLQVFGNDYDTSDGTGVRDYIHVVDLAKGHVAALEKLKPSNCLEVYNLGNGRGVSVLELIRAFKATSGQPIPYNIAPRRPSDVASCYADPSKAETELDWHANKTLEAACSDSWNWITRNPEGYKTHAEN